MKKSRFHLGNPQVFNLYLLDIRKKPINLFLKKQISIKLEKPPEQTIE